MSFLTRATASREAMMTMSAQETVDGQVFSRASLMSSTTSKDLSELMLESDSFSPSMFGVSSSNTDPSHPLKRK